jgi:antirestriction protein ArdC
MYNKTKTAQKPKVNVYKEVTTRIVMRLTDGEIPWRKGWNSPISKDLINYVTRNPYHGVNRLLLGEEGEYMTFNQARKAEGKIKKGTKGRMIIKFKPFIPKEDKKKAEELEAQGKSIEHLKRIYVGYDYVYHIKDIEGIESKNKTGEHKNAENPTDIANYIIDIYCKKKGITLNEKSCDECTFDETTRTITVPKKMQFKTEEEWYLAVFSLLVKEAIPKPEDAQKENEVKDELIQEVGSSMLLSAVRLERKEATENTVAVCQRWIAELNKDYRLIISAATQAEKIVKEIVEPIMGKTDDEDE